MEASTFSAVAAWYASVLSTITAIAALISRQRGRRARVALVPYVIWSPTDSGEYYPKLHLEAVNMSERALSLRQWMITEAGEPRVAGSPYEGRVDGPAMLQSGEMHGWTLDVNDLGLDWSSPFQVLLRLTTGEEFRTEPIVINATRPPTGQS